MTRHKAAAGSVVLLLQFLSTSANAQDPRSIQLDAPKLSGGKSLMEALQDRRSTREFDGRSLPLEVLSSLFWVAGGINRPESDGRTAPSALGMHEIDVYAALPQGLFKYDTRTHQLVFVLKDDVRALTGEQPFVKDAPLNIVYVADYSRMDKSPPAERDFYAAADTAFMSQNVYLYCASEELATVVRSSIDRAALSKAMRLRPDQRVVLAQTVGYPGK